jgi:curli production assembly/transport CsgH protein
MSDQHTALIRGLAAAALGLAVSWARANATPAEAEQVMGIGCRIDVETHGGAVRLEAMARSRSNVSGHYRFDVRKSDEAGTSRNLQSGDFSLEADRETTLSTTVLAASAADHYQARLVLNSNSGSVSCVSP